MPIKKRLLDNSLFFILHFCLNFQALLKLDFAVHPKIVFARGIGVGCSDIAFSAVYKFINQLFSHLLFSNVVTCKTERQCQSQESLLFQDSFIQ
jgi:hypothetical protein